MDHSDRGGLEATFTRHVRRGIRDARRHPCGAPGVGAGWCAQGGRATTCRIGAAEITEDGRWLPRGAARTFHGIEVTSMAEFGGATATRATRAMGGLANFGGSTARWLRAMPTDDIAAVVSLGGYTPLALRLLHWRRSTGVPLIVNVVDWSNPWHCIGGPLGPFRIAVWSSRCAFSTRRRTRLSPLVRGSSAIMTGLAAGRRECLLPSTPTNPSG